MTWNSGHVITPWLRLSWLPQRLWKVTQEAARRLCFLQVYSDNNDHLEQLCIDFHHWSPFPVKWPKGWQQNAPPAHILIILYYLDFFTLCLYKYIFFYPGMKSKLKNNIVPVAGHNRARMWCSITCPAGAPPPMCLPLSPLHHTDRAALLLWTKSLSSVLAASLAGNPEPLLSACEEGASVTSEVLILHLDEL